MVTDGVDPASPVLSDGYTVYTPGISESTAGVTTFYHMDAQGSVVATTSSAQLQTTDSRYDAFGNKSSYLPTAGTFGWNAKSQYQTDYASGLMLLGNRYYDPTVGRFISQDPAQDENNWYSYCGNNPLVAVDPSGLTSATLGLGGTAGAGDVGVTGDIGVLFSMPSANPKSWDVGLFVDYGAGLYGGSPGVNAGPSASMAPADTSPIANGTTHSLSLQAVGGGVVGGGLTVSAPLKTDVKGTPTGVDLKASSAAIGVLGKTKVGGRVCLETPGASVFAGKVTTHTVTVSTVIKGASSAISSAAKAVGGWWNARMTEAGQTVWNGMNNLMH